MVGIYKITSPSGRVYIGQSVNIENRFSHYKRLDCKGQVKLFKSLKKHGCEAHIFEVIEECSVDNLSNREGFWQDFYDAIKKGMNCRRVTSDDKSGYDSPETIEKRVAKQRGVKRPNSSGEKHHNFGKVMPKYLKDKISGFRKSQTGGLNHSSKLVLCLSTGIYYDSIVEASFANGFTYKQLYCRLQGTVINNTDLVLVDNYEKGLIKKESKKNISGKNNPNSKTLVDTNTGILFYSVVEAAKELNIKEATLRDMLRGKQKNKTNLKYA
jgi:group I intron endonuclease